jgi:siroheme synthase (precorrin-2 oxidase/ferrochelatase)
MQRQKHRLVNVADKPHLCDFYLGSVVQKGSVKIAISTNGKSPTIASTIEGSSLKTCYLTKWRTCWII